MSKFVLSKKARNDLKEIAKYTYKTWGEVQCDRYLFAIDEVLDGLASGVLRGHICNFPNGYQKYYVGKHVVFFCQSSEQTIKIIRVLHQAMDEELYI